MSNLFFSTIEVTRQCFYRTPLAYSIVNLKPIVPGHVLVVPTRPVSRLYDLDSAELSALLNSVSRVGKVIERVYGADGLTVACQDGKAAGQTVPHVHFHLLPRKFHGDRFATKNDEIYPALEHAESTLPEELGGSSASALYSRNGLVQGVEPLQMDADEDRRPRTIEEMVQEAEWLKGFFSDNEVVGN